VEVRVRTPLTGQVMPILRSKLLSIIVIILAIITSPIISTHWVAGQSIGENSTGAQVADSISIENGPPVENGDTVSIDTNDGTGEESADGDSTSEDAVDNGGSSSSVQEPTTDQQSSEQGDNDRSAASGDYAQTNEERIGTRTIIEDAIPVGKIKERTDSSVMMVYKEATRVLEMRRASHTLHGSNQLSNLSRVLSSQRGQTIENSESPSSKEAIAHLYTEPTSQNKFSKSNLFTHSDDYRIRHGTTNIGSQENKTIGNLQISSSHSEALASSNQSAKQLSPSEPEESLVERAEQSVLSNYSETVPFYEISTSQLPLSNDSSTEITPSYQSISGPEDTAIENQSAAITGYNNSSNSPTGYSSNGSALSSLSNESSTAIIQLNQSSISDKPHATLLGTREDSTIATPPNSVIQPILPGDGQTISLGDVKDSSSASAKVSFDKQSYNLGDTATITVTDADANVDPNVINTVLITVKSSIDSKSILLTETAPDSGIFIGHVSFTIDSSAESSIKVNPTNNGDNIRFSYNAFHPRAEVVISDVVQPGVAILQESSVCEGDLTAPCNSIIGIPVELALQEGAELGTNVFCEENGLPPPCGGTTYVTMSYANALLDNQSPSTFTIWQNVPGVGWVDLSEFQPEGIIVDENSKTVTALSPFGPGVFAIVNGTGTGGGGGGGLPGAGVILDFVVPLNPILSRNIIPIRSSPPGNEDGGRLFPITGSKVDKQILPTAFAQEFSAFNDTNVTRTNIVHDNSSVLDTQINITYTNNESISFISTRYGNLGKNLFEPNQISLDSDVKNVIISIMGPKNEFMPKDLVIVEDTKISWINVGLNKSSQYIIVKEKITGKEYKLEHNYASFTFKKPGVYEYSSTSTSSPIKGTIFVISKGESRDNPLTSSSTPTIGFIKVPFLGLQNFLKNVRLSGSIILSSYKIPSSSDILYEWSNKSTEDKSLLRYLSSDNQ